MKKRAKKTAMFYEDGDFIVEIIVAEYGKSYEAWLRHKDCGISEIMFGMPAYQEGHYTTQGDFRAIVESNLEEYEVEYTLTYLGDK